MLTEEATVKITKTLVNKGFIQFPSGIDSPTIQDPDEQVCITKRAKEEYNHTMLKY
jgi:hypothetical protein